MKSELIVLTPDRQERFWSSVSKEGECFIWKRATSSAGYGRLRIDGRNYAAHRVAFMLARGPVPDGLWVCHRCNTKRCVNPSHLYLGTASENTADAIRDGLMTKPTPPWAGGHKTGADWARRARGESINTATLTAAKVIEIRKLVAGGWSQTQASKAYGVSKGNVSKIIRRVSWSHLPT